MGIKKVNLEMIFMVVALKRSPFFVNSAFKLAHQNEINSELSFTFYA
jgi:hypothetical protein